MSGQHCPGDSFWSNWSHTPWRCLGVCRRPDDIAPEIPSGATGPTLPGGLWECADVRMTLLWRFLPEQLVPHSLEASGSADVRTTLPRRFLPEQLVPHSLEVSGSVQTSRRHCSRDSFRSNWSHTPWRCLGVSRRPDDIALEIPSGATGPTLPGGVWECPDVRTTLPRRFLPEQLV